MSTLVNAFITNLLLHITTFLRRCEAGSFCGQQTSLYEQNIITESKPNFSGDRHLVS